MVILATFPFAEEDYMSENFWYGNNYETSAIVEFNFWMYNNMPALRNFSILFSSNIYSYAIFCLSYCLFSRDQAFYLAFAYSFTTVLSTVIEVAYSRPQFIMVFPEYGKNEVEQ